MNVKVSIPVSIGGYTGQRDAWEEHANQYTVSFDHGTVMLQAEGSVQQKVTFDMDELEAALQFIATSKHIRTDEPAECKHLHTEVRQRTRSDDSYAQWSEPDTMCLDCGEWAG